MWVTKQLLVPIDFHSIFFTTIKVNAAQQLSLKYLHLCSAQENKINTGLGQHETE